MPLRQRVKPVGFAMGVLAALALGPIPASAASPQPADPQPMADGLAPGLAVRYYKSLFREIDEFVEFMQREKGDEGEPIPNIKSKVGGGPVLTSGVADGVGAKITGLIRFDTPGTYSFVAQSNDGVRLTIGGAFVLEDPDVHVARYSKIAKLDIPQAGWYPFEMLYFERKNTSTIELYWKTPANPDADMAIVPPENFAHAKAM